MGRTEESIRPLKVKAEKVLQMGGERAVAKHREKGKLTARERLNILYDEGTFRELDMLVGHRCTNFGMEEVEIPADGVVTGHGGEERFIAPQARSPEKQFPISI